MAGIQQQMESSAYAYWDSLSGRTDPWDAYRMEGVAGYHIASFFVPGWVVKGAIKARMAGQFGNAAEFAAKAAQRGGYVEVNGLKFSEYYYTRLWSSGRGAPSLVAKEILASGVKGVPDACKPGFFRYVACGWEMVFNPTTKEVWHLMPMK
jgi:hypothetical protein